MIKKIISLSLLLFLGLNAIAQYPVKGTVKKNKKKLEGAVVSVFRDSLEIQHLITAADGRFSIDLEYNNDYEIFIKKDGHITKKFIFLLKGIPEEVKNGLGGQDIEVSLFDSPNDKSLSSQLNLLLSEPIAKFYYDPNIKEVDFDKNYSQGRLVDLQKVNELQKSLEQIEANPVYAEARVLIEKLLGESSTKSTQISSLQKDQEIKALELKTKENEIRNSKLENEKKASAVLLLSKEKELQRNELALLNQSKALQEIKLNAQKSELSKQNLISEKQKKDLELLQQGKRIQELSLKNKEQELKQNQNEIQKQRQIRNSFIGGLLIVLVFAGFIVRSLRIRNKQNKIIVEQKDVVEKQKEFIQEKNKEITDSINYAQRIQKSILPPLSEVKTVLPNSFILFKPKDIISGDFYWFYNSWAENLVGRAEKINNDVILIAAADCTGHGVPGAFMSTIGSEKLNEAVKESTDVSEILNLVNRGMKKVLRQSEKADSTRDGMDISLCSFNKEMTQVEYAGANRPLWIVRPAGGHVELVETPEEGNPTHTLRQAQGDSRHILIETKATKVAIGGYTEDEQIFTKHTIDLQKGDSIYIFSDGYADQFSPQDKKLMTRKFKEIILSVQDKTMEEQKEYLGSFIEDWRGNMEQTDDILVIGVRV